MTLIWALYVCGCGYEQPVQVRIDERVTPEHDCPLRLAESHRLGREANRKPLLAP